MSNSLNKRCNQFFQMLRLVMKVWCLEFKEKNMNNENKLLEYDEVCPYSEGRAAVRKGEFWGYVDENGKLVITDLD